MSPETSTLPLPEASIKPKLRDSNIEILRILAMLMILFHHAAVHGQAMRIPVPCDTLPKLWLLFSAMGGKIGVNVFVLISGYYLIRSKGPLFSVRKVLKLLGEMTFYSIGLFAFYLFWQNGKIEKIFNWYFFTHRILPYSWWFATTYFLLYVLHPFLNLAFTRFSKRQYRQFLFLAVVFFSVIPTLLNHGSGDFLLWFILLYAIGGYLRLYGKELNVRGRTLLGWGAIFYLIVFGMELGSIYLWKRDCRFWEQHQLPVLLASVAIFWAFTKFRIPGKRWINALAATMFGVYLLHDYPESRKFLWKELFKMPSYVKDNAIIPRTICVVAIVFAACVAIDLLRIYLVEKPFMKFVNRHSENWDNTLRKVYNWFSKNQ